VYTNGTIKVQAVVSGGAADSVDLIVDGQKFAGFDASYQYSWDTTGTPEGTHSLVARALAGKQAVDSAPRTVVVDRTPPTLVSHVPAAGATNIFIDDAITATFSEALLPANVAAGTVTMTTNGQPLSALPTLSTDGKTITLAPQGAIAVPTTLAATLTKAITDLAGNALPAAVTWSWQLPQWVAVGGPINAVANQSVGNNGTPAFDASGNPMVAFNESDGVHMNAYVQTWSGGAWLAVGGPINANAGQDVTQTSILAGPNGAPTVIFLESDGVRPKLYVEQWTGTAWSPLGNAIDLGASVTAASFGAPASDAAGHISLALLASDGTHSNAYAESWSGTAWQPLGTAVNPVVGHDIVGKVNAVLNAAAQPILAFAEADNSALSSAYVEQWNGNAWAALGGPINPVAGQSVGGQPPLAITKAGRPVVALAESDGTHANLYVMQWSGTTWASVGSAINPVPGQDIGINSRGLVVDSSGRPSVLIGEVDPVSGHRNAYFEKWNGVTWSLVGSAVNPVVGQDAGTGFLTLDAKDRLAACLLESDGVHQNAYFERSNQ
jgi:hypothetical protein